mmetsp:Transcript_34144/g.67981  ORF Transcript_34144/g.67981 Transcript_34144/m.67981 type:complete len:235 (-) Transcript_34144:272-976(-)
MALARLTRPEPEPEPPIGPDVYSPFTKASQYQGGPGGGHASREFKCGQHFEGYWKDDEQEGKGHLTTTAGSEYDGEWQAGKWHGKGTYKWQSGSVYAGQWVEGKKQGHGTLTLYSGNTYEGEWKADTRHGWGVYKVHRPTAGGCAVYEGEWANDQCTGRGTSKGFDGAVEINRYENGKRVGAGVRWLDPSRVKLGEATGPFRLTDGREGDLMEEAEAVAIAQEIGVPLPQLPFH